VARILYVHVPKCGGTSFGAALRLVHPFAQGGIDIDRARAEALAEAPHLTGRALIAADYRRRDRQLRDHLARGTACISGHVQLSEALLDGPAQGWLAVTLLRDPVARFVSHYAYLQRHHPDPARAATLEAFLDTDDALRLGSEYLFHFGGDWQGRRADPDLGPRAARTLARCALVGDLARPGQFARDLSRLARRPLPRLARNRAPGPADVPASLRARIETICAPDIALFRAAMRDRCAA